MSTPLSVFYSWQSDLPKETNQVAIRSALQEAINKLELADATGQLKLVIDEATRGAAGSPNIPQLLFSKIDACTIFVCDLTTINTAINAAALDRQLTPGRPTANPNVLVELGYAVATVGWERIILLFNEHHGTFPNDLPFDVDRHRATPFTISDKKDKNGKTALTAVLEIALQAIVTQSPLKPAQQRGISPKQIKKEADIQVLTAALKTIHIPTFDLFLDEFPERIPNTIFYFQSSFLGIVNRSTFFLYNQELCLKVTAFTKNWIKSLSYAQHYGPDPGSTFYKYDIPGDVFPNDKSRKDFSHLLRHRITLQKSFRGLLEYVRLNYLEIDLNTLSSQALTDYQAFLSDS